jgi:hypothetical protein
MLVEILVLAGAAAVLAGVAMRGTGSLSRSMSTAACLVLLPLIGSVGFIVLASLSGGG